MKLIKKALWFLRLIDADQKLSLTNIAVYVTLIKLATAKSGEVISPTDVGAFMGAIASYQAKRWMGSKDEPK